MKLSMYSLDQRVAENVEVDEVYFPGPKGETGVLPGHMALISQLHVGELRYVDGQNKKHKHFSVSHGFVRIVGDDVVVCAYTLERPKDIDLDRALKAQKKAEERLKESFADVEEFRKYELKLQRSLIRQHVARRAAHSL